MAWHDNPTPEEKLYMGTQGPLIDLAVDICNINGFEELQKFMRVYDYNKVSKYHARLLELFEAYLNERGWTMQRNFFFKDLLKADWEILELTTDEFLKMTLWAFGPKWGSWPKNALKDLWNKRHKDLFEIAGVDLIDATIVKIRDAWREAGKP